MIHYLTDINECASTPCQHGATCTDAVNGYTCACVIGYTGITCETRKFYNLTADQECVYNLKVSKQRMYVSKVYGMCLANIIVETNLCCSI